MIAYIAACPGCGRDCWWHSYPTVTSDDNNPRALLRVRCNHCDVLDREAAAAVVMRENSVRMSRMANA